MPVTLAYSHTSQIKPTGDLKQMLNFHWLTEKEPILYDCHFRYPLVGHQCITCHGSVFHLETDKSDEDIVGVPPLCTDNSEEDTGYGENKDSNNLDV